MAISFHQSIRVPFAEQVVRQGLGGGISVYSGAQPSPQTIIDNWSTTYNANQSAFLWTSTGAVWSIFSNITVYASTLPTSALPVRNGTAAWAILWSTAPTLANQQTSTIPTTKFIVVNVSSSTGTGVVRFLNNVLSTATSVTPQDIGITITVI